MKASKREKFLLGILLTAVISVVYYQFIYIKQVAKIDEKKELKNTLESKYNDVIQTINTLDSRKASIKILNSSILDKSSGFYPTILQEKIIIELDTLLEKSGLKANIAFSPIEVAAVQSFSIPLKPDNKSTLDTFVNEYKKENVPVTNEEEINSDENAPVTSEEEINSDKNVDSQAGEQGKHTLEQLKVAINFSGSYEALKKFIVEVESYDRIINITNISLTPSSETDVNGSMNLEFYAIPKLGEEDMEYLKWTLKNTYGKDTPFSAGAANGAFNSTIETLTTETNVNDFVMMLRPETSELPTLSIGVAKDEMRESYIYSDNSKVEEVEVEFKEENGKLYYKYKTSQNKYPKDNTDLGKEFKTISTGIVMKIESEIRGSSNDSSGIKLKVINNTTKNVNIIVKNDDNTNPRVSVISEGGIVNITKK